MAKQKQPVGVIGTGLMGMACAKRLRGAGFEVLGHDSDTGKLRALEALGGRAALSLAELAGACDVVVLAVFDTAQVEDVIEGPRGLLALRPAATPLTVVCVSTCDPDRIASLAARLSGGTRVRFVEAPVSGTSDQTARGEALGLIGGEQSAVDAARSVIDAIAPRWRHIGARRQRRSRQARDQPDPRHQPRGAGRRAGVRGAHGPRPGGVPRGRARVGGLFAGHGHQGRQDGDRRFRAARLRHAIAQGFLADGSSRRGAWSSACRWRKPTRADAGLRRPRRRRSRQQRRHPGDPPPDWMKRGS